MARFFQYLQSLGTPNQYLIIGEGPHGIMFSEAPNDLRVSELKPIVDFSPDLKVSELVESPYLSNLKVGDMKAGDARYRGEDHGFQRLFLDWLDHWLNGEANNVTEMPKVQLFVPGRGWVFGDRWPLEKTQFTDYYFSDDSGAGSHGSGVLQTNPAGTDAKDSYVYDPDSPTPTTTRTIRMGSGLFVPTDQRDVEARETCLCTARRSSIVQ